MWEIEGTNEFAQWYRAVGMSGHRKWNDIRRDAVREEREPLRTLSELRRESGLSQLEMAEELGVSQASVSKIERQDDPQVSTLMHYLGALYPNHGETRRLHMRWHVGFAVASL
jgi:DNA-binding XRE family transcriptional regulator